MLRLQSPDHTLHLGLRCRDLFNGANGLGEVSLDIFEEGSCEGVQVSKIDVDGVACDAVADELMVRSSGGDFG